VPPPQLPQPLSAIGLIRYNPDDILKNITAIAKKGYCLSCGRFFLLYIFQFDEGPAGRANHVTCWVFIIIFLFNMRVLAAEVAPFSPFSL
jgi:hypothetical protein